ncbi:MAG: dockerin type I repeat-containing protein [Armatimonadetes bacterium]|nr:dockerin type I repeat-containing protein [Armatimonadota bacterium]
MNHSKSLITLVTLFGFASVAPAKWTVTTSTGPAGATEIYPAGVSAGQSVGQAWVTGSGKRASIWDHATNSWVDLAPLFSADSYAYGTDGTQQVGYVNISGERGAALWTGTKASLVYLSAVTVSDDAAYSCSGGQQVGQAHNHAALWSGTAESRVDLNPPLSSSSKSYGISGSQQVGVANVGGAVYHASLWNGTASSWVDIHPVGTGGSSIALAVDSGQVVGMVGAQLIGYGNEAFGTASLWTNGTASSWVNLDPPHSVPNYNACLGVSGGFQVGYVDIIGDGRQELATLWQGTASSRVNLHTLLGPSYALNSNCFSKATAICRVGSVIYISGFGSDAQLRRALLWRHDVSSVSGRVNTGGGRPVASVQIQFTDNSPDGDGRNVGAPITVPIAENGDYTVSAPVGSDAFRISVKPTGFLRRTVDANVVGGDLTEVNLNLVPGDIVADNVIDLSDYVKLATYFNGVSTDPNWSTADSDGIRPSDCDLNGDGVVDLTDYTLVVTNFNSVGDN